MAAPRCSDAARATTLDPAGTAGSYTDFLLIEHQLPWPRDVAELPVVATFADALDAAAQAGRRVRVQAVLPRAGLLDPIARRVVHLTVPDLAWFEGFARAEVTTTADGVGAACGAFLHGDVPPDAYLAPGATRDVLVCTHGRRDRCCGSLGLETLARLGALSSDVRVWRTSHTGGHRFAPTGITFPDGIFWAYLDDDVLRRIVGHVGDATEIAPHHRGCSALDSPAAQALDRGAFAEFGWDWLATKRTSRTVATAIGWDVELRYESVAATGVLTGSVDVVRNFPIVDCGGEATGNEKVQAELRVHRTQGAEV
jgi:hypothetical protein